MSNLTILGDTSGSVVLQAPAVSGSTTITMPAATGTMMVSGNMPAFSAYLAANQSLGANAFTKVLFDTEEFDTANCFSSSRFTPTVAGYYQVNLMLYISAAGSAQGNGAIYKNGVVTKAQFLQVAVNQILSVPALVYLNGSSDYIEAYAYCNVAGVVAGGGSSNYCYFQAYLARAA
jgi:hypothetical protein